MSIEKQIKIEVEKLHGLAQLSPEWEAQVLLVRSLRAQKQIYPMPAYTSREGNVFS